MGGGDVGRHGQAEPGSAAVAAAALVEADEPPHDVAAPVGGDARAVVVDVHGDLLPVGLGIDAHDRRGVPGRVGDDVVDGPTDGVGVADDGSTSSADRDLHRHPTRPGRDLVHHVGHRERRRARTPARRRGRAAGGRRRGPAGGRARRAARRSSASQSGRSAIRATSSSVRITVTGVRSSWEASETRRRLVDVAVSSRPSMPFIVRASSAISSSRPAPAPARAASGSRSRRPAT